MAPLWAVWATGIACLIVGSWIGIFVISLGFAAKHEDSFLMPTELTGEEQEEKYAADYERDFQTNRK